MLFAFTTKLESENNGQYFFLLQVSSMHLSNKNGTINLFP